MNRILSTVCACLLSVSAIGCAESKALDGRVYEPYGLVDKSELRDPCVRYRLVVGNMIWSVVLIETIAVPFWLVGFQTHEPVSKVTNCQVTRETIAGES